MMNGAGGAGAGVSNAKLTGGMDNGSNVGLGGKSNKPARKCDQVGGGHYNHNNKGSAVIIQQKATVHHVS